MVGQHAYVSRYKPLPRRSEYAHPRQGVQSHVHVSEEHQEPLREVKRRGLPPYGGRGPFHLSVQVSHGHPHAADEVRVASSDGVPSFELQFLLSEQVGVGQRRDGRDLPAVVPIVVVEQTVREAEDGGNVIHSQDHAGPQRAREKAVAPVRSADRFLGASFRSRVHVDGGPRVRGRGTGGIAERALLRHHGRPRAGVDKAGNVAAGAGCNDIDRPAHINAVTFLFRQPEARESGGSVKDGVDPFEGGNQVVQVGHVRLDVGTHVRVTVFLVG